jgi:hypothetical protein
LRVEVSRSGGFAGLTLRGEVDPTALPEPAATAIADAVRTLPFGQPPAPPQHPDSFRYEITVIDRGGRRIAVLDEAQVPADLRPILDAAIAAGS